MSLRTIADATIIPAQNKSVLSFKDGDTQDIVRTVLHMHEKYNSEVKDFAEYLRGSNTMETCNNIWQFLKRNIRYKKDPPGVQWVKSPARTWEDKFCDCKSYAVFIGSLLTCLKIKCVFRFVSFDSSSRLPTHVYIAVPNGRKEIIIDDVIDSFNTEVPYTYKQDHMTKIIEMNGVPRSLPIRRAVGSVSGFGTLGLNNAQVSGGIDTLLNGKARKDKLTQGLPGLATLALYIFIPAGPNGAGNYKEVTSLLANNKNYLQYCPAVVSSKRDKAFATFWNFGDWAGVKVENDVFPQLKQLLTQQLGMDPAAWWTKQFTDAGTIGDIVSSFSSVFNAATGPSYQVNQTPTNAANQTAAFGLINAAASAIPYASTALSLIGPLFGNSDWQWKYGAPETFAPVSSDWSSFKFNPLASITTSYNTGGAAPGLPSYTNPNAPYGTISTMSSNGLTFVGFGNGGQDSTKSIYSNAQGTLVNSSNIPVDSNGNILPLNSTPLSVNDLSNTNAGMNIWLTLGVASAAAYMLLKKKKK